MMRKYAIYIGILVIGMVVGWFLFGGNPNDNHKHDTEATTNQMWTCSMHPQIKQSEPGDCPICGMDLIPAEVGAEGLTVNQFKLTKNALALANVQTTIVGGALSDVANTITLSGKIVENEEANAVQVSYFAGRIERLNVSFTGEAVQRGQLLATIYSPELVKAQQELLTAVALKESQPELYTAVRNKLKLWKLSNKQISQIETSGTVKENFPVYATVSGTVSEKLVNQGDYIKQGEPLLKIANLNSVWANFDAYENQISGFKKGQAIMITSNAYPNEVVKAKILFINPVLNTQTRTVTVRAVLNNSKGKFKPGIFVIGKVQKKVNTTKTLLTIPSSAVLWTGKRSVVYVKPKKEASIFEMREVILGNKFGDNYEIKKGLKASEEIVTNGVFTIDASAQLQGKKSMMNHQKIIVESIEVPEKFKTQLQFVYNSYIVIKDALIDANGALTKKHAAILQDNLSKVDMKLLSANDAHSKWMGLNKKIGSSSFSMSKTLEVAEQREQFKILSDYLIKAVQIFGINETTYKLYCPMADNDKGAYWLSKENKVLNPYFGKVMLKCGEVKETINNN